MPADMTEVPQPDDSTIEVSQIEAGIFAVNRYSGWDNDKKDQEHLDLLNQWLAMEGLEPEDPTPMYAGFDSPYVPGFMRRNEVMLRMSTN